MARTGSNAAHVRTPSQARDVFVGDMYRIYVTLKNGSEATGLELYKGSPPAHGTKIQVPLMRGGSVQARIGDTTNTKRISGAQILVVKEVHADEI